MPASIEGGVVSFLNEPKYYNKYQAIPITFGRERLGSLEEFHNVLTINGNNPLSETEGDIPELVKEILPSHHFRLKYPKADRGSSYEGTSVIGAPAFRPIGEENALLLPTVEKAMIATGIDGGIRSRRGPTSAPRRTSSASDPIPSRRRPRRRRPCRSISAPRRISISGSGGRIRQVPPPDPDDPLRGPHVLRCQRHPLRRPSQGALRLALNDPSWKLNEPERNDVHLFKEMEEDFRKFGTWVELVKEPGSRHYSDTPSIRVNVIDPGGLDLGVQAFVYSRAEMDQRTLDVWVEWLDAPPLIVAGTQIKVSFKITASAHAKGRGGDASRAARSSKRGVEGVVTPVEDSRSASTWARGRWRGRSRPTRTKDRGPIVRGDGMNPVLRPNAGPARAPKSRSTVGDAGDARLPPVQGSP